MLTFFTTAKALLGERVEELERSLYLARTRERRWFAVKEMTRLVRSTLGLRSKAVRGRSGNPS